MTHYSRHQLLLILLLVAAAGAGLAIDHWRRARPDVVERLERLDRAEPAAAPAPLPREARRAAREPRQRAHAVHERAARAGPPDHATGAEPPRAPRPAVPTPEAPLDVNHASAPELARLPGIGTTLAARIVQARPFAALDELARVRGLRPVALARVRPLLTILPRP